MGWAELSDCGHKGTLCTSADGGGDVQ